MTFVFRVTRLRLVSWTLSSTPLPLHLTILHLVAILGAEPTGSRVSLFHMFEWYKESNIVLARAGWDPVTGLGTPDFLKMQTLLGWVDPTRLSNRLYSIRSDDFDGEAVSAHSLFIRCKPQLSSGIYPAALMTENTLQSLKLMLTNYIGPVGCISKGHSKRWAPWLRDRIVVAASDLPNTSEKSISGVSVQILLLNVLLFQSVRPIQLILALCRLDQLGCLYFPWRRIKPTRYVWMLEDLQWSLITLQIM